MTRRIRFDWSLPIVAMTELHIGTGESRDPTGAEKDRGIEGEISTIVRDNRKVPWIPGPTLKGALRQGDYDHVTNDLLGRPHSETPQGARPAVLASALTVFGGVLSPAQPCTLIVRPRTAISAGTGASEANKLFAEEWVPPETRFVARFRLEVRRREAFAAAHPEESDTAFEARAERLRTAFEARLARFCMPDGVAIAADASDGMGRIRFDLPFIDMAQQAGSDEALQGVAVPCTRQDLGPGGWGTATALDTQVQLPDQPAVLLGIELHCPGPYIARGGVREDGQGDKKRQIITPERSARGLPRMHPSGVAGALRKRAEWLIALSPQGWSTQERATSAGERQLTVVERLFGTEGRRGSLNIDVDTVARRGKTTLPFVALDAVTQAPVNGALFSLDGDYGVTARLRIGRFRALAPDEEELLKALLADIAANGLFLGGGSSKGWGWFNSQPTTPTRAGRAASKTPLPNNLNSRLPDARITLPYRMIKADPSRVLWPEDPVAERIKHGVLLSDPIPEGVCGWLDVSWCVETPILIGDGKDPVSPQMLDGVPVLPGSTLRGLIRNVVETVTQARFTRLDPQTLVARVGQAIVRANGLATHQNFVPDFAQALFGHVIEPETAELQQSRATHQAYHLKSRLAFGYAPLQDFSEDLIDSSTRTMQLLGAKPKAVFYDQPGRKTYFATAGTASVIEARLDAHLKKKAAPAPGKKVTTTDLKFLNPPSDTKPLVFRGRIRFHNVTMVELGALLWAVTLGNRPYLAHRIGHARAYGAGRGYADDLRLHIVRNDGAACASTTADEVASFGLQGHSAQPARASFVDLLKANGLAAHDTIQELLAAADPAIGEIIRSAAGLGKNGLGYQVSETFSGSKAGATAKTAILAAQGNRLAAMLKPKPDP